MPNMPAQNITLAVGTCPACAEDLIATVDLVPESLARPVVAKAQTVHPTDVTDPWAKAEAKVDLTVRLTGFAVRHVCGTRAPREGEA